MNFMKVRRRISYRERMQRLNDLLNKSPTREVTIRELVRTWNLSPNYVKRLMRWCAENYDHIQYDSNYGVLYFQSEVSPTYRMTKTQTKLIPETST